MTSITDAERACFHCGKSIRRSLQSLFCDRPWCVIERRRERDLMVQRILAPPEPASSRRGWWWLPEPEPVPAVFAFAGLATAAAAAPEPVPVPVPELSPELGPLPGCPFWWTTVQPVKREGAWGSNDSETRGLTQRRHVIAYLTEISGGICQLCMRPVTDKAGDWKPSIDHIVPRRRGGRHELENLQLAHWRCNTKRHADMFVRLTPAGYEEYAAGGRPPLVARAA